MKKCKEIWDGLKYSGYVLSHPIRGFYEMRFEGKGNLWSCLILLVLMILAMVSNQLYVGTIFSSVNMREFNIIHQIAAVLIPVLLWCVANWSITVLMDGEGRFRDIFMATCYATMPYMMTTFIGVLLSNVIAADEATFMYLIVNIGLFFTGLLLFTGMVTVHQFTVKKSILALILTIAAMAFIAFLAVMFMSIVNDLINFIKGVIVELELRM